jgi:hypothetical protein
MPTGGSASQSGSRAPIDFTTQKKAFKEVLLRNRSLLDMAYGAMEG